MMDEFGLPFFGWVMGASSANGSAQRENANKQTHQFMNNKAIHNERSED